MAEVELLAELELAVWLRVVLVQVLQEGVQLQGRREWMRKIGVDHNRQAAQKDSTKDIHLCRMMDNGIHPTKRKMVKGWYCKFCL